MRALRLTVACAVVVMGARTAAAQEPSENRTDAGVGERTYGAAIGVSGRESPFRVTASGGYHRVVNADNVAGGTRDRFEGRLLVTVGAERAGRLN